MKGLKIQDLQEGKLYKFHDNDGVLKSIYMINKQGELYCGDRHCKNKNDFLKSTLSYNIIINGYFDEIEREIDWSKVPRGTKVQVRDDEDDRWKNRYFIKYNDINDFKFLVGMYLDDNFMGYRMKDSSSSWKYCRIHESVEIPDEWYKEVE